jgi:outer membrane protein assembly factor BamA
LRLLLFLLLLLSISIPKPIFSATVDSLEFIGNIRTDSDVIKHISRLSKSGNITTAEISEAEKRLMRTNLFISVSISESHGVLTFEVEEKWTLIPYFNVSSGGDVVSIRAGLYDINLMGKYLTLGGEYHFYDGTHNGSLFFEKKEIGKKRLTVSGKVGQVKVPIYWFKKSGDLEGGFLAQKRYASASLSIPLVQDRLFLGGALTYNNIQYSEHVSDSIIEINRVNGYNFYDTTNLIAPTISLTFKKFNHYSYTYDGWGVSSSYSRKILVEKRDYNKIYATAQWYKKLPLNSNLAFNVRGVVSDGHDFGSYSYLGGTNGVRGYSSAVFRGRVYGVANGEFRIPSLNTKWLVLQHIFFADFLTISERPSDMSNNATAFGGGVGVRILSPKVHSFMIRADYGWAFGDYRSRGFYFGTSHYFLPF